MLINYYCISKKGSEMKLLYYLLFAMCLIYAGCSNQKDDQLNSHFPNQTSKRPTEKVKVSDDTLLGGDTFVTTGPAGMTNQKKGKIVVIADSGLALPVKINDDNKIMALGLNDSTVYEIKKDGDHTALIIPDSNKVLKDAKMMLLTDDGEMLEVKLLGGNMVVLTRNNTMLPLAKK